MSAIDHLIRHTYCKNGPTQGTSYGSHDRIELQHIERLNILQLIVSFKSTVEEKRNFKPLSYIDMKKAFRTLPEMGVLQVPPDEDAPQNKGQQYNSLQTRVYAIKDIGQIESETDLKKGKAGRLLHVDFVVKIHSFRYKVSGH